MSDSSWIKLNYKPGTEHQLQQIWNNTQHNRNYQSSLEQRLKCQTGFLGNGEFRLTKPEDAVLICVLLQNGLKKKLHFSTSGGRSGFQGDEVWALDK